METKVTQEEIERAADACLRYLEAKERMIKALIGLGQELCSGRGVNPGLWPAWMKFCEIGQRTIAKDAVLTDQLNRAKQAMFPEVAEETPESKAGPPERPCRVN